MVTFSSELRRYSRLSGTNTGLKERPLSTKEDISSRSATW